MRIFVSSSFEDLREHRAAAIRVLRQLGHEVLAMEDMIAGSAAPLPKVVEMVDRSEAYVGVFAWRYGYVYVPAGTADPPAPALTNIPVVEGAVVGETSITHYEYLRAVQRKLPVMAFLLDEHYPWPPQLIDGFDKTRAQAPANADKIRALRQLLQQERVVSWFTTPTDLEARVSAAVTMAGLTRQLDLQPATALPPGTGVAGDSSAEHGIRHAIIAAGDHQRALKIDLATTWWSTRLYLIASLAQRLTQARRILVVDTKLNPVPVRAGVAPPGPVQSAAERFVGQLSTSAILSTIGPKVPALGIFAQRLQTRSIGYNQVHSEIHELLDGWRDAFGDAPGTHVKEDLAKIDLTAEVLRRWFGDAMLQQPVHIADLQRASVVDLLRLLDYPNDYVPVLTRHTPDTDDQPATERVDVVDKGALNARLARSYLVELLDRARIV
jgi:Domain of unknown function (DUF4062)